MQGSKVFCSPSTTNLQALSPVSTADFRKLLFGHSFSSKRQFAGMAAKPASIAFSRISGAAANKLLKGLGINEVDGFDLEPLEVDDGALILTLLLLFVCYNSMQVLLQHQQVLTRCGPTGLQDLEPFNYSQFPDEDTGTPHFVAYHAQQLQQCGVQIGPGGFRMHDLHKETLYHIEVDGKHYNGGVDAGLIPHGIMPSSAASMLRIAFEHKQSTVDKDQYRVQHNITQVRHQRKRGLKAVAYMSTSSHCFCRLGQPL